MESAGIRYMDKEWEQEDFNVSVKNGKVEVLRYSFKRWSDS